MDAKMVAPPKNAIDDAAKKQLVEARATKSADSLHSRILKMKTWKQNEYSLKQ